MKTVKKIKESLAELYKKGFFHIFGGSVLNKIFAFISGVVVARLVTKEEYASLSHVDNIFSYGTLFAGLGMATAVLKYCSSDDDKKNKAYIRFSLKYGMLVQFIIVIILIAYLQIADAPFKSAKSMGLLFCLYPIFEYGLSVASCAVRALLENKLYMKMSVIQTASVMFLGVLLVTIWGIEGLLGARYIAVIIALCLGGRYLIKRFRGVRCERLEKDDIRQFMSMSISLMVANLFSMIMPLNETFLINNLLKDEVVSANYKVAIMLPMQLTFITSSIMVYFFPVLSRMRKNEVWKTAVKIGKWTGGIIAFVAICGMVLSKPIIFFVYGEKYLDAAKMASSFWIVYSLNAGFRMIPMNILPTLGYAKFNAVLAVVSCIVHLGIDYVCIKYLGIYGVAYATGFVYIISGILYWIYLYKVSGKQRKESE